MPVAFASIIKLFRENSQTRQSGERVVGEASRKGRIMKTRLAIKSRRTRCSIWRALDDMIFTVVESRISMHDKTHSECGHTYGSLSMFNLRNFVASLVRRFDVYGKFTVRSPLQGLPLREEWKILYVARVSTFLILRIPDLWIFTSLRFHLALSSQQNCSLILISFNREKKTWKSRQVYFRWLPRYGGFQCGIIENEKLLECKYLETKI